MSRKRLEENAKAGRTRTRTATVSVAPTKDTTALTETSNKDKMVGKPGTEVELQSTECTEILPVEDENFVAMLMSNAVPPAGDSKSNNTKQKGTR